MKGCSPMNHKLNLKKQLACIYTNNFFSGLRITDAVWVALLAARGFSLWEIGVAESVFHMVSLTFEVPSGMAADLLGRRKTLVAGGVCMVLSNLLMAFAPDLFFICLAMALSALANAMFSGTASALTYDSLKQCGRTDDYLRVSANCSQLSMLATAVGSLASTLERFLRFSGFYLLSAAFEGTAAAATALMTEPTRQAEISYAVFCLKKKTPSPNKRDRTRLPSPTYASSITERGSIVLLIYATLIHTHIVMYPILRYRQ